MAHFPKVAFVAGTLGGGGAELQLYYMVQTLCRCGAPPVVLSANTGETWRQPLIELGVPVLQYGARSGIAPRLRQIIRLARQHHAEILQAQHFFVNPYVYLASRISGIPEIGAVRNDLYSELQGSLAFTRRFAFRRMRLIACNSELALQRAVTMGVPRHRLVHLPNVVDTVRLSPTEPSNTGALTVAAIGRLSPQKRFDRLLRIFAAASAKSPQPLRLLIAGDGPQRAALEEQARQLGISAAVEFLGFVPDPTSVYARTDIFLLTSDHEGTPNVIMEAMASGLPILATPAGDTPRLLAGGTAGYILGMEAEDEFAAKLLELAASAPLRRQLGAAARAAAEQRFSLTRLPDHLERLYQARLP